MSAGGRMPFGKFRGVSIVDLPDDYLAWLRGLGDLREPLRSAIEAEWRFRQSPVPEAHLTSDERQMAEEIVSAGYRALAKAHHPDRGGDTRVMQLVNAAAAHPELDVLARHLAEARDQLDILKARIQEAKR